MNHRDQGEVATEHQPLACMRCNKELLETGYGICVWIPNCNLASSPFFTHVYWACKGQCDKEMQAYLGVEKYVTRWEGIDDLTNPLEYKRWARVTSRLIDDGRLLPSATIKVKELKRIIGPLVARETTKEDIARFLELRMLDGL